MRPTPLHEDHCNNEGGDQLGTHAPSMPRDAQAGSDTPAPPSSSGSSIRRAFLAMTVLFSLNHGCTVSVLGLANARLGSVGVRQSGVLYASYTLSALFGASWIVDRLGSRSGLVLGTGLSSLYVTSFYLATAAKSAWPSLGWLVEAVALTGAAVGGLGSSVLWVSQGAYFSAASKLYSSAAGIPGEDVTSKFGGDFASLFLLLEVCLKLLSTSLIEAAGVGWRVIFGLYTVVSIVPVVFLSGIPDLDPKRRGYGAVLRSSSEVELAVELNNEGAGDDRRRRAGPRYGAVVRSSSGGEPAVELNNEGAGDVRRRRGGCLTDNKATASLNLLLSDPKMKYLALMPFLFGLSSSFSTSVINGEVVEDVLNDDDSAFVGLFTALTSLVAAAMSFVFGWLESRHESVHLGKGLAMSIGGLCYFSVAVQFLVYPTGSDWSVAGLAIIYTLLGISRATYEGTLRSVTADMYPDDGEGAFGNIILFGGSASTLGYVLSVTDVLRCEQVSRYCVEYSDGSIHNVLVMEVLVIVMSVLAIPSFWRAIWMFRSVQSVSEEGADDEGSVQMSVAPSSIV